MVIKSTTGGINKVANVIRYIFKNQEPEPCSYSQWRSELRSLKVQFTYADIQNLLSEAGDGKLSKLYEACENDIQAFMEQINSVQMLSKVNVRGNTIEQYIAEFKQNFQNRIYKSKDSIAYHHLFISFSPKDKEVITRPMLKDISDKFCALRGVNNIYLTAAHFEKEHPHIHIVMGNALSGLSSSIRQHAFEDLKKELSLYAQQKYSQIQFSNPQHGKQKSFQKNINSAERGSRVTQANECLEALSKTITNSSTLFERLQAEGYSVYYRNGNTPQGLLHNESGTKMRWRNFSVDVKELLAQENEAKEKLQTLQKLHPNPARQIDKSIKEDPDTYKSEDERLMAELSALRGTTGRERENTQPDIDDSSVAEDIEDVNETPTDFEDEQEEDESEEVESDNEDSDEET